MKRKMKKWVAISLCIAITNIFPSIPAKAGTMLYNNATGNQDGYSYELWKDYGNTSMELNNGGNFSCSWSNIGNALFRKGKKFNSGQNWSSLNGINVDYGCQYNPSGNSYLCVYGWTRNPLVEYYIVDSWGSWRPPGSSSKGTITVDGGTYDIYETTRVNQPSIDGNTTFQQYWSVRTSKKTSGSINVAEHFRQWEQRGMRMGSLVEVALTVEGYQSSGNANVYKNDITIGGGGGGGNDNQPTSEPASSTRSAYSTIEAEQFNSKESSTLEEIGTDSGRGIGYIENGNFTTYSKIQFGNNGANKFTAKVATEQDVTIQVRSGSASGALLGTLSVPATGGWDTYKTLSTDINNFTGTNNIVLVFSGPVNVDSFKFSESSGGGGNNPTPTGAPSGSRSAFDNIEAEDYDSNYGSNMQTFNLNDGGSAIGYIEDGYWITFKDVDFGNGTSSVMYRAATQNSTTVQIRSGSANGTILGTMSVSSTGSWDTYQDMTDSITYVNGAITGVQDITLVFSGAVNLDYFKFMSNGNTPTSGPTATPIPTATPDPNAKSAYSNIEAEDYDSRSASNIETFTLSQGGSAIGYIESGNSTTYKDIDFGNGALSVTANAATEQDATIEVHAGSANGTLLGTISVGSTGSWDTYKTVSASISKTTGVKDIVLVYSGAVNLDYIKFSTKTDDSTPVVRNKTFQYCPNEYKQGNSRGGNVVSLGYYARNSYGGQDYKIMNVYLPYGYNANDKSTKYNVFYLMHGGGENENTIFGGAGRGSEMKNILDNMIANGKCAPMIVVTPTSNKGSDDFQKFYSELVDSVIPKIAQTYNTYAGSGSKDEIKASRDHRAFGGFSMGSVCTWSVFSNDLAYVKYFMPLSGDCWQFGNTAGASQSQRTAEFLASSVKNAGYGANDFRLFCATGANDIAYPNMNPMIQAMKNCSDTFQTGRNFFFIVCNEGSHQWSYINQYVYNYLPDLFQ